ncbi:2-hydroxychromene-2-carboxylate isomerase [Halopseudomonas nanhaiensis]|uniref:2-hydroxychromene-2-carboxylate isomerase n=1 Tax=Halopseudomonas nanhaiensis TaxID=2830842 RepID=UPI001CBB7864|nr:2-hydroxychromene-2-carboxylate isomerase [Halopseudomonas nanhaiensis]UAW98197.1 2-hydroxychromene-2-carboxylate isomerase [Halopseudomonas nanhaiensis]
MSKQVEFFFDVGSPASYLAWTQLPAIAERQQAQIVWKPMLLGGVFQATGNSSPATVEAKGRYTRTDMQRFARRYGATLNHNPHFPINTLMLMRGAVGFLDTPRFHEYLTAIFTAMWVDERDMHQPQIIGEVLAGAGFDPQDVLARCNDPAVKDRLKALTTEAVERGVFGAPTFFVDGEMYFGQDRLDWVERALGE